MAAGIGQVERLLLRQPNEQSRLPIMIYENRSDFDSNALRVRSRSIRQADA